MSVNATSMLTKDYLKGFDTAGAQQGNPTSLDHSVLLGFLIAILAMGLLGNGIVIYVIACERRLHKAPFYFLVCISVTDLSKAVFCLPFVVATVYNNFTWKYGEQTCTVMAFSNSFLGVATAIGLLAVAIDRYMSASAPRFYSKCSHGLVNLAVILVGWGVAFCLSFPPIFEHGAYKYIADELQCTFNQQPYRNNDTLGYTISFLCVMFVIIFLYLRIFLFFRSRRRMAPLFHEPAQSNNWAFFGPGANGQALINLLNGFTGPPTAFTTAVRNMHQNFGRVVNLRVLKNEHLTRLFFLSSVVYILLWLPYLFHVFVKVFWDSLNLSQEYIVVAMVLSHGHVAVCPCVYLFLGSPIRDCIFKRFKELRLEHPYMGVSQNEADTSESNVRCVELEV